MKKSLKLFAADLRNLSRIKWLWAYALFFFTLELAFFYTSGDLTKVLLSTLSVSLLIVPLVSSFLGITYYYDSRGFMEYLLSQPVTRISLILTKFLSLLIFLYFLFLLGTLLPLLFIAQLPTKAYLLFVFSQLLLTLCFVSLSFLVGVVVEEKAKGVSIVLMLWLYATILHDGVILATVYIFRDYPLEVPILVLTFLNPVDLARLLVILNTDIAALMGLTGTVFKELLGSEAGLLLSFLTLGAWGILPFVFSLFIFRKKDF